MKTIAVLTLCVSLAATSALARPTSDQLEDKAIALWKKANKRVDDINDAVRAHDIYKACDINDRSHDELMQAIDLLNQEIDQVNDDQTLNEDARAEKLTYVKHLLTNITVSERHTYYWSLQTRCP